MRSIFIVLFCASSVFAEFEAPPPSSSSARLALSYKGYSFSDDGSGTLRVELSHVEDQKWSVFGHVNFNRTLGEDAFHFRINAGYWLTPDWKLSLEGAYCTNDVYVPNITVIAAAAYTHEDWLTPSLALTYAHTTQYDSIFASPTVTWSLSPTLSLNAIPMFGFSQKTTAENTWSGAGILFATVKPTTWVTLFAGGCMGNLAFDYLGTPELPADYLSTQIFGAFEFFPNKLLSAGVFLNREWRSNDTTTYVVRLFSTFRW